MQQVAGTIHEAFRKPSGSTMPASGKISRRNQAGDRSASGSDRAASDRSHPGISPGLESRVPRASDHDCRRK